MYYVRRFKMVCLLRSLLRSTGNIVFRNEFNCILRPEYKKLYGFNVYLKMYINVFHIFVDMLVNIIVHVACVGSDHIIT